MTIDEKYLIELQAEIEKQSIDLYNQYLKALGSIETIEFLINKFKSEGQDEILRAGESLGQREQENPL